MSDTQQLLFETAYRPYGRLRVYFGNMFSGKTDELHHWYDRAHHGHIAVQGFKSQLDDRDGLAKTKSRRGRLSVPTIAIRESRRIFDYLQAETQLILLDEVQFFEPAINEVVRTLRLRGINIIAGGLDLDYLARPFGQTLVLAAQANEAKKLTAICHVCRYDGAEYTQMINKRTGEAVTTLLKSGEPIFIEGASAFQARCGRCFVWPSRQNIELGNKNEESTHQVSIGV